MKYFVFKLLLGMGVLITLHDSGVECVTCYSCFADSSQGRENNCLVVNEFTPKCTTDDTGRTAITCVKVQVQMRSLTVVSRECASHLIVNQADQDDICQIGESKMRLHVLKAYHGKYTESECATCSGPLCNANTHLKSSCTLALLMLTVTFIRNL